MCLVALVMGGEEAKECNVAFESLNKTVNHSTFILDSVRYLFH